MVYSDKCHHDLETHWDATDKKCVPCNKEKIKPGYEFTPNCGYADDGGRREDIIKACGKDTFNDGTFTKCQPCRVCPSGLKEQRPCNATSDTLCGQTWSTTTMDPSPVKTTHQLPTAAPHVGAGAFESWQIVAVTVGCSVLLVVVVFAALYLYRRRGNIRLCSKIRHRSSIINNNGEFSRLGQPENNEQLVLSPQVQAEPLQAVLDNLDVLEELVILLDPDVPGVKSSRHLASRCSYPAAWITYSYSMKEVRSPLKALLEGLSTKHPDWSVGHLASMLQDMGRHDAVAVLNKLSVTVEV